MPEAGTRYLGKLESVHRGASGLFTKRVFLLVVGCVLVFACGIYLLASEIRRGSTDYFTNAVGSFICLVIPLAVIFICLWNWFLQVRHELRIYEFGLTCFDGKTKEICLWDEVAHVSVLDALETPEKTFTIVVEKRDGGEIVFNENFADVRGAWKLIDAKFTTEEN